MKINKGLSTSIWGAHVNFRATVTKKTCTMLNPESQGMNPQQMLKYSRNKESQGTSYIFTKGIGLLWRKSFFKTQSS